MLPLLLLAALASAEDSTPAPGSPSAAPAEPAPAVPAPAAPTPAAAPAAAPTTTLFPIRAANLSPAEARAAEILFRRRLELALGQPVTDEAAVLAAVGAANDAGLLAACGALGCTRWVTLDLVRLDRDVFVIVQERDATGTVLQRVETDARGLDGLSVALDRVARAIAGRVPLSKVPMPTAESAPESLSASGTPTSSASSSSTEPLPLPDAVNTTRPGRARDTTSLGFKLGVHGPLWPNFQLALSSTFTYRSETKDNFLEVNAGFTLPLGLSDDRTWGMLFSEVGLFHMFKSPPGTTFYAGGGLGPRLGGYDDLGFGVGVYGAGGVAFGPRERTHTYLQLKVGGDAFTSLIEPYVIGYTGLEAGVGF